MEVFLHVEILSFYQRKVRLVAPQPETVSLEERETIF